MHSKLLNIIGLRRFSRDEDGSASIEAMIMMPMVIWFYLAMFSFFQTYQEINVNQKAAYTIGDMISRETFPLDSSYIDGVQDMLGYLTRSSSESAIRITSLQYDTTDDRYYVQWSKARGGVLPVDNAIVADWNNRIPILMDKEYITITETWTDYDPPFNTGLGRKNINNFVFTRPRYAPRVLYQE